MQEIPTSKNRHYVLLIGRGMSYTEYRANQSDPATEQLNLVPTFGFPASDVMLASADGAGSVNLVPIGDWEQ